MVDGKRLRKTFASSALSRRWLTGKRAKVDLRHETTSRLARYLANPLDLMRVTGYRDLKSLDRYYQPVMQELADKIEVAEPTSVR
ncbi:hypothetical protein GCM10007207_07360 [Asaia siamensis]|uniref:Phage integrase family protein n=1 Tax=Asaia siamensis TaxID=110479 RepID=A0ABQ1LJ73_9PROT|nr:hypothetical protein [Asaia siamensis]GBR04516.1 phage DNA recombinase [Asaia siamensis NRIC 0323]GGC24596.1 hypothetical protein GCM10007207_07360 [Asaia siamensis]